MCLCVCLCVAPPPPPGGEDQISAPMYIISVTQKTDMYISVHQEDERCEGAKPYLDIGVTVLQIQPDYSYVWCRRRSQHSVTGYDRRHNHPASPLYDRTDLADASLPAPPVTRPPRHTSPPRQVQARGVQW